MKVLPNILQQLDFGARYLRRNFPHSIGSIIARLILLRDRVMEYRGGPYINAIDKVFVINLDSRSDRWQNIEKRLRSLRLPYERLRAIDGRSLTQEQYDYYNRDALQPLKISEIGCFLSHQKAWRAVVNQDLETAWIIEDDVLFLKRVARLDAYIDRLTSFDRDWEFVYTDRRQPYLFYKYVRQEQVKGFLDYTRHIQDKKVCRNILMPGPSLNSDGYIICRRGAEKLLQLHQHLLSPLDVQLSMFAHEMKIYAFHPRISKQDSSLGSDIQDD